MVTCNHISGIPDGDKGYLFVINNYISSYDLFYHLRVCILPPARNAFLVVWFDQEIERVVDHIWQLSPSEGFLLHEKVLLTLTLQLQKFLPEISVHECAPVPFSTSQMNETLGRLGLHLHPTGQLNRVYATVTYWPWKDGCPSCALKACCSGVSRRGKSFAPHFSKKI